MNPKVIAVTEGRAVAAGGRTSKIVIVQYTVGPFGPFTLDTTEADLSSGVALQKMQDFARTLGNLPSA